MKDKKVFKIKKNPNVKISEKKEEEIVRFGKMLKNVNITTIYVGNLRYNKTEIQIKGLFNKFGKVTYVEISNKHKGTAFVQMPNAESAKMAIKALNNTEFDGRTLKVSIAKQREVLSTEEIKPRKKIEKEIEEAIVKNTEKAKLKRKPKGLDALFNYLGK